MLPLISAGLGAGLSLFGEISRKNQEERDIKKRKKALKDALIDDNEEAAILSNINRNFNTESLSSANQSALGLGNILNKDTMRGLNSSVMLGQRASQLSQARQGIMETNRNINLSIGDLPNANPINAGNVLMGGLGGLQIGESLEQLKTPTEYDTTLTSKTAKAKLPDVNSNISNIPTQLSTVTMPAKPKVDQNLFKARGLFDDTPIAERGTEEVLPADYDKLFSTGRFGNLESIKDLFKSDSILKKSKVPADFSINAWLDSRMRLRNKNKNLFGI